MVGGGTVKKKPSLLYSHKKFFQILIMKPQHSLFILKKRRKDAVCYRLKTESKHGYSNCIQNLNQFRRNNLKVVGTSCDINMD